MHKFELNVGKNVHFSLRFFFKVFTGILYKVKYIFLVNNLEQSKRKILLKKK